MIERVVHESGEAARHRSGRDSPHQLAGRQSHLRSAPGPTATGVTSPARSSKRRSIAAPSYFDWEDARARSGKRTGIEGARRWRGRRAARRRIDRLRRPDDHSARRHLHVQSGVGNLGTHSVIDLARVAADVLDAVGEGRRELGRHQQGLAVDLHVGRQPDHARHDAREPCGAMDAKRKLQEIAARDLGGDARRLRHRRRARVPQRQPARA